MYCPPDVLEPGAMDGKTAGASDKRMTEKDWRSAIAASHGLMPDSIARTVQEATEPGEKIGRKSWLASSIPLASPIREPGRANHGGLRGSRGGVVRLKVTLSSFWIRQAR